MARRRSDPAEDPLQGAEAERGGGKVAVGLQTPARAPAAALDSLAIDGDRISARLRIGTAEHELAYTVRGAPLQPRYEPFLVAALPIAMAAASSLHVPEPVSPRLLAGLATVQRIYSVWFEGEVRIVELEAEPGARDLPGQRGTASFFSRGVDSYYTVLRNLETIDSLVYAHGFDVAPHNRRIRATTSRVLDEVSTELQRPVVEVETSLREVSDRYWRWGRYHGAFLASVGLLLAPAFERVLFPAAQWYGNLVPGGSHPLIDPLWSTEAVEFVNDGCATRVAKVAELSRSELAMRTLRVCWNEEVEGNCGRCEKCLRTMASLRIAGVSDRCAAMPGALSLRALSRSRVRNDLAIARELVLEADARGADPALRWVLRYKLARGVLYQAFLRNAPPAVTRLRRAVGAAERRLRR